MGVRTTTRVHTALLFSLFFATCFTLVAIFLPPVSHHPTRSLCHLNPYALCQIYVDGAAFQAYYCGRLEDC